VVATKVIGGSPLLINAALDAVKGGFARMLGRGKK